MDKLNDLLKYDIIEIAWAAGLIEGEGCFTLYAGKTLRIVVGSVDEDVIVKLKRVFNVGNITHRPLPSTKELYVWQVTKKADVIDVMQLILPFMCKRRSERIEFLLKV